MFRKVAVRSTVLIARKVEFAWNDRQFVMPGHVAGKIQAGATRNLVVQGINPTITEDRIRSELDHIHNLVIIEIVFANNNARISLNSVHNALFARTCLMSRASYKGMRIEFYSDECAQPLPSHQVLVRKEATKSQIKKPSPTINRFQMLNIDGTEDESSEEDDETDTFPPRMTSRAAATVAG